VAACTGTVLAFVGGAALWTVRPKSGPESDLTVAVWEAVPSSVEGLGGKSDSCTFSERIVVEKQHRVALGEGDGVGASCKYVMHLDGWPQGEDECILEFPVSRIRAVEATTVGSRLAARYYWRRQGGLMIFRSEASHRVFISLDARWCRWVSVTEGLRAIP